MLDLADEAVVGKRTAYTEAGSELLQLAFVLASRKNVLPVHIAGEVSP